jgi:hypothetical protein
MLWNPPVTSGEGIAVALEAFYGSKLWEYSKQGTPVKNVIVATKTGYETLTRWPDNKITECWRSNRRLT